MRHTFNLSAVYDLPIGSKKRYDLGKVRECISGRLGNRHDHEPEERATHRCDNYKARHSRNLYSRIMRGEHDCDLLYNVVPNGFTVQLPSINGSQPLPAGFMAVVNGPGGGSSRQTRRPDLIAGVNPFLDGDRNFLNPAAFAIPAAGTFGNLPATL